MKSAANFYISNEDFKVLDDELIVKYDSTTVAGLWDRAENLRADLTDSCERFPKHIRKSLAKIIPYMAVYKTLLDDDPSDAYELVAEQSKMNAIRDREYYVQQAEKNPRNVIKILAKTIKSDYNEKLGFEISSEEITKDSFHIVVTENPYEAFCAENGCPELARIFYDRINYLLANLPGLIFKMDAKFIAPEPSPDATDGLENESESESDVETEGDAESVETEGQDEETQPEESPKSSEITMTLKLRSIPSEK